MRELLLFAKTAYRALKDRRCVRCGFHFGLSAAKHYMVWHHEAILAADLKSELGQSYDEAYDRVLSQLGRK